MIDCSTAVRVEALQVLPHTCTTALAFSEDGSTLTTLDGTLVLRDWDAATGELLRELELASVDADLRRGSFSPDGQLVAASLPEQAAGIWNRSDGVRIATLPAIHL